MKHFRRLNHLRLSSKLHLNNKLHLNPELKLNNKLLLHRRKLRLHHPPLLLPSPAMRPSPLMHPKQNRQIPPTLPPVPTQTDVNNQTTDSRVKVKDKYEEVDLEVKVKGDEEVDKGRGVGAVERLGVRRGLLGEVRLLLPSRRRCDEEVSGVIDSEGSGARRVRMEVDKRKGGG
jgi:hypothetical protein